ncbi:MAG TPA: PLP-dependent aminotransferase family protein [Acidimicrobiales bacterium]|nr:PLP-dependent aminotransferase family protein [Acidimicrobiales bacterium]
MREATKCSWTVLSYGDPRGSPELRNALATYLGRARGVVADPELIFVCSGTADVLGTVAETLRPGPIAMEDPGTDYLRNVVHSLGAQVVPLPVDEEGASGNPGEVRAAVVTPAHQFPLGMALSPSRRTALVQWAAQADGFIVEDDYDGEFRFAHDPLNVMQALSPDRVLYIGTASKCLAPALRMAWAVVPPRLAERFLAVRRWRITVPTLDQLALAVLIESGRFDRHLHRRRRAYRARRDQLGAMLGSVAGGFRALGIAAGLHAVIELPETGPTEGSVISAAERLSVGLEGLRDHWHSQARTQGIVVGYSRPPEHAWPGALGALRQALEAAFP